MGHEPDLRVARVLTWIAGVISIVIVIGLPSGYFGVTYSYEAARLQRESDLLAESASVFAYTNPALWRYEEHRIKDLVLRHYSHDAQRSVQITDTDGDLVAESGISPRPPTFSRRSQVHDGPQVVGTAVVTESLQPILYRTAAMLVFSLLLGVAIYVTLRLVPFRIIERLIGQLVDSNAALETEISAKEVALEQSQKLQYAIQHQALHDDLTKLANRTLFTDRLEQAIRTAHREKTVLAVFYLDLNRFKEINDTRGHHVGD